MCSWNLASTTTEGRSALQVLSVSVKTGGCERWEKVSGREEGERGKGGRVGGMVYLCPSTSPEPANMESVVLQNSSPTSVVNEGSVVAPQTPGTIAFGSWALQYVRRRSRGSWLSVQEMVNMSGAKLNQPVVETYVGPERVSVSVFVLKWSRLPKPCARNMDAERLRIGPNVCGQRALENPWREVVVQRSVCGNFG